MERVVFDELFRHVSPVLSNQQHGFIPGKSCATNLAVFLKTAWEAISDGYQTDAIYTDYSAAFQSVNHTLIIHKLKQSYHVRDIALKWFVSYSAGKMGNIVFRQDWCLALTCSCCLESSVLIYPVFGFLLRSRRYRR